VIEPGQPLLVTGEEIHVPADAIDDELEVVYKLRSDVGEIRAGNYVIAELRNCARTGELVIASAGPLIYVGRFGRRTDCTNFAMMMVRPCLTSRHSCLYQPNP
jgi:hypothetical protein